MFSLIEENFELSENMVGQAIYSPVLDDLFDLLPVFIGTDTLCVTLALDTERLAPSVHSWPEFNSFAEINDDIYAAGDAGIYRLGGDTDDGAAISAGVVWGKTSFRKSNKKKIRALFLEGEIDGTRLQAETESGSGTYTVSRNRISVGRNLIGRDWSLKLSDFDRLEAVEIAFVLGRR